MSLQWKTYSTRRKLTLVKVLKARNISDYQTLTGVLSTLGVLPPPLNDFETALKEIELERKNLLEEEQKQLKAAKQKQQPKKPATKPTVRRKAPKKTTKVNPEKE